MPLLAKEVEIFPDEIFSLPTSERPWAVAHVRSRQEKTLARHLLQNGIPFYLPLIENRRTRAGRNLVSFLPLFTGYVFFRAAAEQHPLVWRSNVAANVISEGIDQEQLNSELSQLRALQLAGASLVPQQEFAAGEPVRIASGPFAGYSGIVVRESGRDRLIVQISLIKRAVAVEFGRSALLKRKP